MRLRCTYNFHLGDEKMRTRIIRKMIGASLLAVTLLTASFAMHEVAYAIVAYEVERNSMIRLPKQLLQLQQKLLRRLISPM